MLNATEWTFNILFLSPRRFSAVLPFISPSGFDALSEEFIAYQILPDKPIPEEVWSEAALTEEGESAVVHYD